MSDRRTEGLYGKFEVRRTDGRDAPGGKHDGCTYFVLDLQHDKHMPAALRAYARSCEADYPTLASELRFVADDFGSRAEFAGVMAQKPALDLERQRMRADALAPPEPPDADILVAALQSISDSDDSCWCNHTDEDCCAKQPEGSAFCAFCISEIALAKYRNPFPAPPRADALDATRTDSDPLIYFVTEVVKKFEADEAAGYHTRDRAYAIDMLKKGLESRAALDATAGEDKQA